MSSKCFLVFLLVILLGCNGSEKNDLPEIEIIDLSLSEGNSIKLISIYIFLSKGSDLPVTITVRTVDETADAGSDYIGIQDHVITFPPNTILAVLDIKLLGDPFYELDETFLVEIVSVENAEISKGRATVKLINDDPGGFTKVWGDEFDSFNTNNWSYEEGESTEELQYNSKNNVSIEDGKLIIEAREENEGGMEFTSGLITSKDKFEFKKGRIDIRAKLPKGKGILAKFWMLGANVDEVGWPSCGQIDIAYMYGGVNENIVVGTIYWSNPAGELTVNSGSSRLNSGTFNDDFHVFSIVWDDTSVQWYVDDKFSYKRIINAEDQTELRNDFFLNFNIVVGSRAGGDPDDSSQFPQQLIIDYVRLFQR